MASAPSTRISAGPLVGEHREEPKGCGRNDIPLIELRPADGAGLEEMFLELTAQTQRDTTSNNQPEGAAA